MFDVYLAGGWFTPEEEATQSRVAEILKEAGYDVCDPKKTCDISGGLATAQSVFRTDCSNISASRAVVCLLDGDDPGTLWEAGYAYSKRKPILYYTTKPSADPLNLMIAMSGRVVRTEEELRAALSKRSLFDFYETRSYKGPME